jgi:sugar O-acyltransferase (sialic acid O-acetyltransferase NeuD family)
MANLLILGAGGHGKVVSEIARLTNQWERIAFLDDREDLIEVVSIPVIGKIHDFLLLRDQYSYAFVAIGNCQIRMKWLAQLTEAGYLLPTLIHPFSSISQSCRPGDGTVVMPGVVINANTSIGRGCILNTSSSIDHDCIISDGVHVAPGAHLGGTVTVGPLTWIGLGASINNNVVLGENVFVAAGAVVHKDIQDNVMVAGVPATVKKQLEEVAHGT